jgi:hypothetical protein
MRSFKRCEGEDRFAMRLCTPGLQLPSPACGFEMPCRLLCTPPFQVRNAASSELHTPQPAAAPGLPNPTPPRTPNRAALPEPKPM